MKPVAHQFRVARPSPKLFRRSVEKRNIGHFILGNVNVEVAAEYMPQVVDLLMLPPVCGEIFDKLIHFVDSDEFVELPEIVDETAFGEHTRNKPF